MYEEPVTVVANQVENPIDFSRFSKYTKLRGVVAKILSWKYKLPKARLLELAESKIWFLVQRDTFADETKELMKQNEVSSRSHLLPLSPFLDKDGLMRARGRLRKANIEYQTKHPIILSSKHPVVKLFLEHQHRQYHHQGVEYIRSQLQQKFWILGLRNELRATKHRCKQCRIFGKGLCPRMSD